MADNNSRPIEWWREARFGMFIHWGLYAVLAGEWQGKRVPGIGEWIMFQAKIPIADYAKLTERFNPFKFDADTWVKLAHAAGTKYLVITAKHHDGFAMFKSVIPYNIVDATPFKRDPMKELAAACHKYGVRLLADGREIVPFHQEHDRAIDHHLLWLTLPATAPDQHVSVIALDLAGQPDVDPLPVQQPDGSLVLPAYLGRLKGPAEMKRERSGFITGWKSADGRLTWSLRLREPGHYRVFVQTYMDRESAHGFKEQKGREYYGNHRMRVTVDAATASGIVGRKDLILDESVNRWHTAESDLGEICISAAGAKTLTLELEQCDPAAELGPTVCGIRLSQSQGKRAKESGALANRPKNKMQGPKK